MRRIAAAALGAASLALPAVAQAHVSVHPNVLPAGSNPTLFVRGPNDEDGASTIEVDRGALTLARRGRIGAGGVVSR